ncbi:ATP-dependent RNA helicase [Malassezia cuniculi]|uniref:ATP-dependent RNA helicase n=1 Tax=Malassezia cuniculi TaxID=948313 RepID=A0AAF0EQR4_9BASI|nr:ATP-dependent RNA helicase [Malassezia cuniculi]
MSTTDALETQLSQLRVDARVNDSGSDDDATVMSDDAISESEGEYEHACAYCGVHNKNCVVQCLACKKWFCNGRGKTSGSHIVMHMVRSRHKEVMVHPDAPLAGTIPECYSCGSKNAFVLGFIPAKGDSVVVLLCRHPCASVSSTRHAAWDTKQWSPLIEDRAFLSWFIAPPTDAEMKRARPITAQQIHRLEDVWRENENASLDDLGKPGVEDDAVPTRLNYTDAYEYMGIFSPLVEIEAKYNQKMCESQAQHSVVVRWEERSNKSVTAFVRLPQVENGELQVAMGDEVILRSDAVEPEWVERGYITRLPTMLEPEIAIELTSRGVHPPSFSTAFVLEFVWKNTSFARMQVALKRFAVGDKGMSAYIRRCILGNVIPDTKVSMKTPSSFSAPGLPEPNHSQIFAIKSVLSRQLSLIQGPPGTGKTVTSATIVYQLCRMNSGPVLVCASSNVAVDQLTEKLHATGLQVVRLTARSREAAECSVSFLTLHEQVARINKPDLVKLRHKRGVGELSKREDKEYRRIIRSLECELLRAADVVCTTCVSAGDERLRGINFRTILIDEATQATEPESMIPISLGCKQLVFVGDHQQLGPVVMSPKAAKAGLQRSLFERLVLLGIVPLRLEVQYRMHPCLSEFPSNMFYEGMLQNGVTATERTRTQVEFPWPDTRMPMMFYRSIGQEEMSGSGTSFLNRTEASAVEKIITHFLRNNVLPSQIGVITPYQGQRAFLVMYMQLHGSLRKDLYSQVEVASVDAFQGREKDYIILSCVRSSESQGIGFLRDSRRLNVALTRAKYGIVIVGNPKVLNRDILWHYLLMHYKQRRVLVEGPLTNLQPSAMRFMRPRALRKKAAVGVAATPGDPLTTEALAALTATQHDRIRDMPEDLESLHGYKSQASIAAGDDMSEFGSHAAVTEF